MTQAYPLQWPQGWPRTPAAQRTDGRYKFARGDWRTGGRKTITMTQAAAGLREELRLLGARGVVISTDWPLRNDGQIRGGARAPDDPGVAVYFTLGGRQLAMARDAFIRSEDNLRSLALAIDGMRQLERHGGRFMMETAFTGFAALPPPGDPHWAIVLGLDRTATRDQVQDAWKRLVRERGEDDRARFNVARDQALKEIARRAASPTGSAA